MSIASHLIARLLLSRRYLATGLGFSRRFDVFEGGLKALIVPRLCAAVALLLALSACASLPENYPRQASYTDGDTANTRLGRAVSRLVAAQAPADSGHHLLSAGLDAFAARVVMIRQADRSIDLQSYFFATTILESSSSTSC